MAIVYKTKEIEVEHHEHNDVYVITMFDENGESSEWVPFTKDEMSEFVRLIGEELNKK